MAKWVFFFDETSNGKLASSGYVEAPTAKDALRLLGNDPQANVVLTWDEIELPEGSGPVWFVD